MRNAETRLAKLEAVTPGRSDAASSMRLVIERPDDPPGRAASEAAELRALGFGVLHVRFVRAIEGRPA